MPRPVSSHHPGPPLFAPARFALPFLLLLVAGGLGCASTTPRCAEFSTDSVSMGGGIGAYYAEGRAHYGRTPALPVSEEAAIYAKRLRTACQLVFDGQITYDAYREEARAAYESYERSRRGPTPPLLPPTGAAAVRTLPASAPIPVRVQD